MATPSCLHGGAPGGATCNSHAWWPYAGCRYSKNNTAVSQACSTPTAASLAAARPNWPPAGQAVPSEPYFVPLRGVIGRKIKEFAKSQSDLKNPPPTACRQSVSGSISLPLSGCFSPFPHGTCSLSVIEEYLGLEGGPPTFRQGFTCPALLEDLNPFYPYGTVTHYGTPFQTIPVLRFRPLAWSAFARHY